MASGVYSVSQINSYIKNMFSQDFLLNRVTVSGEVSNCKYHPSGHIYFTLKDETGTLSAVMFANSRKGLNFKLANGQMVQASGMINVYERDGKYQLYASSIIPNGRGELYVKYEALKKELEEMGMFDESYKRKLPFYAQKIGIVTAPSGAAIQDIINISHRRNPYVQLYLYPAVVQGDRAARSIVRGIKTLDKMKPDVIIIGRGGGSIEDLWAFNEESVARAIFECNTPVISAVGHETDFTIADFVADMRAPTPSAAAELAVTEYNRINDTIEMYSDRLNEAMNGIIEKYRKNIENYRIRLQYLNPVIQVQSKRLYLDQLSDRLSYNMKHILNNKKHELYVYSERLNGLSPLLKLSQGYSYIENEDVIPVNDVDSVSEGELLNIYVKNGIITSKVTGTKKTGPLK